MVEEKRAKIFSIEDRKSKVVVIPEWDNMEIEIKELSAEERANVFAVAYEKGKFNLGYYYCALIIEGAYDPETKKKIFRPADLQLLLKKNGIVIERLALEIAELSGMGERSKEVAEINFQIVSNWNSTSILQNSSDIQSETSSKE